MVGWFFLRTVFTVAVDRRSLAQFALRLVRGIFGGVIAGRGFVGLFEVEDLSPLNNK